jgi:hypothetical protein
VTRVAASRDWPDQALYAARRGLKNPWQRCCFVSAGRRMLKTLSQPVDTHVVRGLLEHQDLDRGCQATWVQRPR